jgi:hypothetical protein
MVGQKAEAQEASCASARGVVDRWRVVLVVGGWWWSESSVLGGAVWAGASR